MASADRVTGEAALLDARIFTSNVPLALAYAPARLDVLGGIADYAGATVLEMPLACGVYAAAQASDDGLLSVQTDGPAVPAVKYRTVSVPLATLLDGERSAAPERLRDALQQVDSLWAAYVVGPLAVLYMDGLLPDVRGVRIAVWSNVPSGAGISSSAALEVASIRALQGALGFDIEPLRMAELAQRAEHRVALAPCGIMDQVTSLLGKREQLLMLRCQPAKVLGYRRLPAGVRVFGIDSGVAHSVAGEQYGRVRTAAFMGRAVIVAQGAGDPPGSYLCNLDIDHFEECYAPLLPEQMKGSDFVAHYGTTGDTATRVDLDTVYHVRDCASHPVHEQVNVNRFLASLDRYEETHDTIALQAAGDAMYRSHRSYSARCGLGNKETDLLVHLVRKRGAASGLFGAKITGGGAGGTVAILAAGENAAEEVERVAVEYAARSGNCSRVLTGSSEGAWYTPVCHVPVRIL